MTGCPTKLLRTGHENTDTDRQALGYLRWPGRIADAGADLPHGGARHGSLVCRRVHRVGYLGDYGSNRETEHPEAPGYEAASATVLPALLSHSPSRKTENEYSADRCYSALNSGRENPSSYGPGAGIPHAHHVLSRLQELPAAFLVAVKRQIARPV
jgi:hypothetical protein